MTPEHHDHRFDVFGPYEVRHGEAGLALAGGMAAAGWLLWQGDGAATAIAGAVLSSSMILVSAIDRRLMLIPDLLSLPAIGFGLVAAFFAGPDAGAAALLDHAMAALLAAASFYLIRQGYRRWRGVEGLGLGDVKLAAAAGAWVGLDWLGTALLIACLGALAAIGIRRLHTGQAVTGATALPLGAFIAPAIILAWMAAQWPL